MSEAGPDGADDRVVIRHEATALTVGALRDLLAGLPEDVVVHVAVPDLPGESSTAEYLVTGVAEPRRAPGDRAADRPARWQPCSRSRRQLEAG